jgi:hypothetical protein
VAKVKSSVAKDETGLKVLSLKEAVKEVDRK